MTLRVSGEAAIGTDEYVDETYVLRAIEEGTKVLHEVNFSHAGLPWFLKALLKAIHLVGRPPGKSPLDGLKELAEDIGVKTLALVGNKVRSDKDREFLLSQMLGFEFLGFIPFDGSIIEADLEGRAPFEKNPEGLKAVKEMIKKLAHG